MPVFRPARETMLMVKPSWQIPPGLQQHGKTGLFEWSMSVVPARPDLLPTTVVLGDSYFDAYVRSGFGYYFNEIWRHRLGPSKLSEIAEALPVGTRFVVLEFIEVASGILLQFADQAEVTKAVDIIARRP